MKRLRPESGDFSNGYRSPEGEEVRDPSSSFGITKTAYRHQVNGVFGRLSTTLSQSDPKGFVMCLPTPQGDSLSISFIQPLTRDKRARFENLCRVLNVTEPGLGNLTQAR